MKQRTEIGKNDGLQIKNRFRLDVLLILSWFTVGILLRFYNLGDKPPSSIEVATLGFSLGHGFSQIPIDEIIPASTLLAPLKFDRAIDSADVVARLLTESTHPPLYFWLTHWWFKLFLNDGELVSLTAGRSLSAIFGGLAIPAIFGLSWVTFRLRLAAHFAAILMAISPYGIYLAQEARHYTLSILWIIISLTCWAIAINYLYDRRKLPWGVGAVWILVNSLAIATHYFVSLALVIQAVILVGLWFLDRSRSKNPFSYWWRIVLVAWGTLAAGLVWIPIASGISSNELTSWIATDYSFMGIFLPLLRMLGWLITMVALLPIEGIPKAIAIISGLIMLWVSILIIPWLIQGWRSLFNHFQLGTIILTGYCWGAIIISGLIIYGSGKDISLAARYHFIYFPVVIVLLGAILAQLWQYSTKITISKQAWFYRSSQQTVVIILVLGLLGSLTVVNNLGFRKSRQSNLMAEHILDTTTANLPTVVASSYTTHSQLREAIALAYSFQTKSLFPQTEIPQFLLLRQNIYNYVKFRHIVLSHPKPLDIWSVNLKINPLFLNKDLNCAGDRNSELSDSGYKNRLYHCQELE